MFQGTNNTAYQSVPSVPLPSQPTPPFGHNVPFGVPPYVQPTEFTPVPNPGVVQGPGSIQPPSPSHAAPVQPVVTAPPPPPPTVQTADTSNVPGRFPYEMTRGVVHVDIAVSF